MSQGNGSASGCHLARTSYSPPRIMNETNVPVQSVSPTSRSPMTYRIGIDAGSKTLKLVVLDEAGAVVYDTYMRHRANIARTLGEAIHDLNWRHGPVDASIAMTGSAAIEVARVLGIPFVQEVVATTHAVRGLEPDADVVIELGGEDAKIIYLDERPEQRMNATCAGGTGGFIDTIAYMLDMRSSQMSQLAFGASRSYPIASRCAVFAQTDVRPLLNAGASKADIAASVFDAVVRQTLSGLACGRPIRGNVVFLGGPLEHMPYLVHAFRRTLGLSAHEGVKPKNAHLFTVTGAALLSDDARSLGCAPVVMNTSELERRIADMGELKSDLAFLPPLFEDANELAAFRARHAQAEFERQGIYEATGPLFLGIDAGSTTLKLVALNADAQIVYSVYEPIRGDLIETLREALDELYRKIEPPSYLPHAKSSTWIARACATGYGEELLRAAFGVDMGVVETAAHLRSARHLCDDLDFLLDIGGQDMKALWVRHGMVTDAALNEACSSGCGAFIEGTAAALKTTPWQFADDALLARHPIDLGTKCTVFMNSRVKHAQKAGAPIEDIAAGVAYSVVKNALHRIIGDDRIPQPGQRVVVQGGTFRSDAVLRAFELLCGVEAVRPAQAHLMGAIGCALFALDAVGADTTAKSGLISLDELRCLEIRREKVACTGCANACELSIVSFDAERTRCFVSDNRCERGLDEPRRRWGEASGVEAAPTVISSEASGSAPTVISSEANEVSGVEKSPPRDLSITRPGGRSSRDDNGSPNVIADEQRLIASFGDIEQQGSRGSRRIGLMDSMALYAYRPFWRTLLAELGFSVMLPRPGCEADRMSEAWETVPSESACYPAKTSHVRYFSLCEKGADAVFMPRFTRNYHCPVQTGYASALAANVGTARSAAGLAPIVSPQLANYRPVRFVRDEDSMERLFGAMNELAGDEVPAITRDEFDRAFSVAVQCQEEVNAELAARSEDALRWLADDPSRHGIVLAGRPYHMDEALLHGIDRELARLGFAVLGVAGLAASDPSRAKAHLDGAYPWMPAKRLVGIARFVAGHPQLDAVFLQSFGCGFEAVSVEEAADVLDAAGKPCTTLKVDDISDLAHIRIRLRTLAAAIAMRGNVERSEAASFVISSETAGAAPAVISSEAAEAAPPVISSGAAEGSEVEKSRSLRSNETGSSASFLDSITKRPLDADDLECARRSCVKDVCFTANAMAARVIRMLRDDPGITRVELPQVCETCLTDAVPRIVERACGATPEYVWVPWGPVISSEAAEAAPSVISSEAAEGSAVEKSQPNPRPRIGIVGNPLIVFEPFMNDHIVEMLESLGCEPVMPDPALLAGDDVRYLDQLALFAEQGIHDVIYLLSFGCLKGHVSARGALRELHERFADMRITVIDYDPESSALNRENRIRLAVDAAR
ncbi:MAG: hypothetical protein DBY20_01430 [Coriobacteriia bacterium]|nr:MAG: hypothetical protein DBY20_01430 [Coriobacteriia bacterium]